MKPHTQISFVGIKRIMMVLTFILIQLNHMYANPKPDTYSISNQQVIIENEEPSLPPIYLKEGTAFIKGKVHGYNPASNSSVRVAYFNPIMNSSNALLVDISENGDFLMEVTMLSNSTCLFTSDYYSEYILLSPGDTCFISIDANKVKEIDEFNAIKRSNIDNQYVHFSGAFAEINNDLNNLHFWSNSIKIFSFLNKFETVAQYKTYVLSALQQSLKEFHSANISQPTKDLITINLQQQAMSFLTFSSNIMKNHSTQNDSLAPAVDISYFLFLKEMNINSQYSFYGRFYYDIINNCRQIEDCLMPFNEMIKKRRTPQKALVYDDIKRRKDYLARILQEDHGPAFDLLEATHFALKIRQNMTLDEWEIEALKQLKEPEYYNYLIRKNELLSSRLKNLKEKSSSSLFDATAEKDNYFENILSDHKGNVIMINHWSMSCRPCLMAIDYIEPLKIKYKNKKVVFIYLSDDYPLYTVWENKAIQIEGVHYRLNKKQIDYMVSKYELKKGSTPVFLLFDKNGECLYKQNGYAEFVINEIFDTIDKKL